MFEVSLLSDGMSCLLPGGRSVRQAGTSLQLIGEKFLGSGHWLVIEQNRGLFLAGFLAQSKQRHVLHIGPLSPRPTPTETVVGSFSPGEPQAGGQGWEPDDQSFSRRELCRANFVQEKAAHLPIGLRARQ